jgi:hypothetical protein
MLVFTSKEAFFYCPDGLLTESAYRRDDPGGTLAVERAPGDKLGIKLCGLLHNRFTIDDAPSMYQVKLDYSVYRRLVESYVTRTLTYEADGLNAFSGILAAQSRVLGQFHWALPINTFTRALLLDLRGSKFPLIQKLGFPSWSWLGWKLNPNEESFGAVDLNVHNNEFLPLVHVFAYDEHASIRLLSAPRDYTQGVEGYIVESIEAFNREVNVALPLEPNVKESPPVSVHLGSVDQLLIFWSYVAHFHNRGHFWHHRRWDGRQDDTFEVVLIGGQGINLSDEEDDCGMVVQSCCGIIIVRTFGYVRKVGMVSDIPLIDWTEARPKLELIYLI